MVFFVRPHVFSHINSEAFNLNEEELKTIYLKKIGYKLNGFAARLIC